MEFGDFLIKIKGGFIPISHLAAFFKIAAAKKYVKWNETEKIDFINVSFFHQQFLCAAYTVLRTLSISAYGSLLPSLSYFSC